MKGWLNAFGNDNDDDDGPTFYSFNNRTSVNGDVAIITVLVIFVTVYAAFVLVFPGIRKEKLTTFLTVTFSVFIGCSILVSHYGSSWFVSRLNEPIEYKAFGNDLVLATVEIYIGLSHVNITLKETNDIVRNNSQSDIDYNERFRWRTMFEIKNDYMDGIRKGLPFPILTVAEYFTMHDDGFCWGTKYRSAGYYANITLWSSFVLWLFANIFLIMVPKYAAYLMLCCGVLLLSTSLNYTRMIVMNPMLATLHLQGRSLKFSYGWCFWIVLFSGMLAVIFGVTISVFDWLYPNRFSTALEIDFDTPFDRHVIDKENHYYPGRFGVSQTNHYQPDNKRHFRKTVPFPRNYFEQSFHQVFRNG